MIMTPKTDKELAFEALRRKGERYSRLWDYYDGSQPTAYTTTRLRELFKGIDPVFTENWCEVVVRTTLARLHLEALGANDEAAAATLARIWDEYLGDLMSTELHEAVLVTGEGFIIAWRDERGLQVAHNDPRLCHVFYEPDSPTAKRCAAKWWVAEDETLRMVLYYPDRLEYYRSTNKADQVSSASELQPWQETAVNPFGVVPVFHFRRTRRLAKGELQNVVPIQNAINKLAADMMVAAEYGAFKQRWIISQTDAQGKLRNAPNEIWSLPAGDGQGQPTTVGEFSTTELSNYLNAIDNLANTLAVISATPKHYMFRGSVPSGEALMIEEAPLVSKVQAYQRALIPEWQIMGALLLFLADGRQVPAEDITPKYAEAAFMQPRSRAEITQIRIASGVPLESALRLEGFSEAEVEEILAAREAEEARRQQTLGQAMLAAQRRADALKAPEDE